MVVTLEGGYVRSEQRDFLLQLSRQSEHRVIIGRGRAKPVTNNRNKIAQQVRNAPEEVEWWLTLDNDVVPACNPLDYIRMDPDVMIFPCPVMKGNQDSDNPIVLNVTLEGEQGKIAPKISSFAGVMEAKWGGTGCMLINRRVLEHPDMKHPFQEEVDEWGISQVGHDMVFCQKAREAGFRVWAAMDCICHHYDEVDLALMGALLSRKEAYNTAYTSPANALNKRVIFTLSPGRCGTGYLARVLDTVPGVIGMHEPRPNFAEKMRTVQTDPSAAYQFWLERKLPSIICLDGDTYAETSHLFAKGFCKPLLDIGIVPDLIALTRPKREVALSMWRRTHIPGRNKQGNKYHVIPTDPGVLVPYPHWEQATDYQLCYWYTVEMEARIKALSQYARRRGVRVFETTMGEIVTRDGFMRLLDALDLPEPGDAYDDVWDKRMNANPERIAGRMPDEDLDETESEIDALRA